MCPILFANRAQVVGQFALLIAQFPDQAAQLTAQRDAALAVVDAQLALYRCGAPYPLKVAVAESGDASTPLDAAQGLSSSIDRETSFPYALPIVASAIALQVGGT